MSNRKQFDADTEHPWAKQWRIPRVHSSHPRQQYEVAVCVPDPDDHTNLWDYREPPEDAARIIGSYIDYRRSYYNDGWQRRMLARPFDIDDSTNTVILALTPHGWKYRRMTHRHGLWPFYDDPRQDDFPPTAAGLVALLDHICEYGRDWPGWKAEHPEAFDPAKHPAA
ncbi:hypothetical protein [Nocardia flavorosea]|uniref:Uncharacterized protein n=1 Tax=Nocardia flavorosea TaxID=53429 RepID=A0A846YRX7_9NOCA|nr:hypothetical protein [Nocardia flavorosea]NKY60431.1 hypothetical protein [Nocardia flavorosea]